MKISSFIQQPGSEASLKTFFASNLQRRVADFLESCRKATEHHAPGPGFLSSTIDDEVDIFDSGSTSQTQSDGSVLDPLNRLDRLIVSSPVSASQLIVTVSVSAASAAWCLQTCIPTALDLCFGRS